MDDNAWDSRLHARATSGSGGGSGGGGDGGGGGGCGGGGFGPRDGGAWASSVCRHAQLPPSDARPLMP